MIFKGGTSLSKAYDVIHRFSEDVDLSLDREQLGFVGDRDPEDPDLSGKKQKKLLQELEEAAKKAVGGQLLAEIQTAFGSSLEQSFTLSVDPSDPQTILFAYPALAESDAGYVKPVVRFEFGARGVQLPEPSSLALSARNMMICLRAALPKRRSAHSFAILQLMVSPPIGLRSDWKCRRYWDGNILLCR